MSCLKPALLTLIITLALYAGITRAQQPETQNPTPEQRVAGPAYEVPEILVYLTDEDANQPLDDREVFIQYVWGWDILNKTPRTPWVECWYKIELKARTNAQGMLVIPARIVLPSRRIAPDGLELSEPTFRNVKIGVYDAHHNSGLYIQKDDIESANRGSG